ncbi:exocyst complex component SEC8 [Quillaja saponaria]|uniref:Exocyst complex component Sec8 n=1 Tax=Quillaja saponaria TaxID=32244 RepID=A0AAD7M6F4_QUISA|nr:exocyst complex component SEC8 [Quillaja saponaria]
MDEVVQAYHSGFNRAIQNYSQILRLFSESTESIAVLKVDSAQSKKCLSAQNKQLHQLWNCVESLLESDDEVQTTTAVALSVHSSQSLSRRTRSLKGDNQRNAHMDGSFRPGSVDGGSYGY